ncbi:phosphatase PAP2 family protein [Patulibacter sp. S7RM1-6]
MPRLRPPFALVAALLAVVAVLGVVVRGRNAATRLDARIVDGVAGWRPTGLVDVARVLTELGQGAVLTMILLVGGLLLVLLRRLPPSAVPVAPVALAVGAAAANAVKAVVERPRPPLALHEVVERSSGFPSGHSTQSAAGWMGLALVLAAATGRRWPVAVGAAVTAVVGVSRVVLGVHSPTDVLGGWSLGLAVALLVVAVWRALAARRA